LRKGRSQGELDDKHDARKLACYFNSAALGLGVLARTSPNAKTVNGIIETILMVID